ncbi:hypothetical protein HR12_24245 [Microbacterium sp. SUBG005]|nr:hypothetical protein HR12_24245 [Microbacterium sp. SUBG005]
MEVATGEDVVAALAVAEHERVVGGGIRLPHQQRLGEQQRFAGGSVHLRGTAQRVRILNATLVAAGALLVGELDLAGLLDGALAALREGSHVGGDRHLAGCVARGVDALVEGVELTAHSLEREREGHVRLTREAPCVRQREARCGERDGRAVDERQNVLLLQLEVQREAGSGQGLDCRHPDAAVVGLGLLVADHDAHEVCERGEVTRGADRPLTGDHREDVGVEHLDEAVDALDAHA